MTIFKTGKIVLFLICLVIASYLIVPEAVISLIMSGNEESPRIIQKYQKTVKHHTRTAVAKMDRYGISKQEMISIISRISDDDLVNTVTQLEASGYTSKREMTNIILLNLKTGSADISRIRQLGYTQLPVDKVKAAVNKIKGYSHLERKIKLPLFKSMVIESIKHHDRQ